MSIKQLTSKQLMTHKGNNKGNYKIFYLNNNKNKSKFVRVCQNGTQREIYSSKYLGKRGLKPIF